MANELNEEELLGTEYVDVINQLAQQTTQKGGGFYQLDRETNFEDRYPNAINDFLQTEGVKSIADKAGVGVDALKPPIDISDETISQIDGILASADPLTMTDAELVNLRSDVDQVVSDVEVPTTEQLTAFINAYVQFVSNATDENISLITNTREIVLVSTDISLDNFLVRTNTRKLVIIGINKLAYPFINERFKIPSDKQADLEGITSLEDSTSLTYTGIIKTTGVTEIKAGSQMLITNNAKRIEDLEQQKVDIEWISEDSQAIELKDPLLFDIDSSHVVQIYQYTDNNVLSPGELIKIPQ